MDYSLVKMRRGFSLLELFVVLGLVLVATSFALAAVAQSKHRADIITCQRNLSRVGQALIIYSDENRGLFPRAGYDPDTAGKPIAYSHPQPALTAKEMAAHVSPTDPAHGPGPNDVTAALFLLVHTTGISPNYFLCPAVRGDAARVDPEDKPREIEFLSAKTKPPAWDVAKRANFSSIKELSYSFNNPYPRANSGNPPAGRKLTIDYAIAADMNPGSTDLLRLRVETPPDIMRRGNSLNHEQDGQNVLYPDGHVDYVSSPFAGVNLDNIYTYGLCTPAKGGDGIVGPAAPPDPQIGPFDSVLLPTANTDAPTAN